MKPLYRNLIWIIIFTSIETFFYFKIKPKSLDTFFMIWAFIFVVFLLFNILNAHSSWENSNFAGSNQRNFAYFMGKLVSNRDESGEADKKKISKFFDSANFLYILFVIINFILMLVVMP